MSASAEDASTTSELGQGTRGQLNGTLFESMKEKEPKTKKTVSHYIREAIEYARAGAETVWSKLKKWIGESLQDLGEEIMPKPKNTTM